MRGAAAWLFLVVPFAIGGALVACPSSDTTPPEADAGPQVYDAGYDSAVICDTFTSHGKPCGTPSPVICFPQCTNGGCMCKGGGPDGGGVWSCVTDTSCLPDAPNIPDGGDDQVDADQGDAGAADAPADG